MIDETLLGWDTEALVDEMLLGEAHQNLCNAFSTAMSFAVHVRNCATCNVTGVWDTGWSSVRKMRLALPESGHSCYTCELPFVLFQAHCYERTSLGVMKMPKNTWSHESGTMPNAQQCNVVHLYASVPCVPPSLSHCAKFSPSTLYVHLRDSLCSNTLHVTPPLFHACLSL
eukprot:1152778-Pelagomonas_calceolata.AAC.3